MLACPMLSPMSEMKSVQRFHVFTFYPVLIRFESYARFLHDGNVGCVSLTLAQ